MYGFKKKIEELVEFKKPPIITYKFWDKHEGLMYDVREIHYSDMGIPNAIYLKHGKENILQWYSRGILIPSTGFYDNTPEEIYMGDIVICDFLNSAYKDRVYQDHFNNAT